MTLKNELLANKKHYMALQVKLWKQLSFEPSLFLTNAELEAYEQNRQHLISELRFCADILDSIRKQLN
jgi:hypothetical protein